jgi:hypothetical protein
MALIEMTPLVDQPVDPVTDYPFGNIANPARELGGRHPPILH